MSQPRSTGRRRAEAYRAVALGFAFEDVARDLAIRPMVVGWTCQARREGRAAQQRGSENGEQHGGITDGSRSIFRVVLHDVQADFQRRSMCYEHPAISKTRQE